MDALYWMSVLFVGLWTKFPTVSLSRTTDKFVNVVTPGPKSFPMMPKAYTAVPSVETSIRAKGASLVDQTHRRKTV